MRSRVVVQGRGRRQGRGGVPLPARVLWGAAEAAVTCGVLVLLLVVHQLWWTNREARADAHGAVEELRRDWARSASGPAGESPGSDSGSGSGAEAGGAAGEGARSGPSGSGDGSAGRQGEGSAGTGRTPTGPRWDRAYAVLRIPKLGVTTPVARGVGKASVLNRGYTGHYPGTAGPGRPGNFALAGHRNTHGEPFRYINRLRPGDTVEVETRTERYVYAVRRTVPQTLPGDGTVLAPEPYSSVHPRQRMSGPGYYLTLTTCTPEYTSRYRLVVWGELRSARPK